MLKVKRRPTMMPSKMQRALRPASQVVGPGRNSPLSGLTLKHPRAHARHCLPVNDVVTVKFRQRRVAKAGPRKIAEVRRVRVVKKRLARVVVKKKMASLRPHRVGALRTAAVPVRVTEAVMRVAAALAAAAVRDSATLAQAPPEAHLEAVAATAAIRLLVAQAMVVVATTAAAAQVAAVPAIQAVAVDTTVAVRVAQLVVKAVGMVAVATAVRALAPRAHVGVIAASRHPMDAAAEPVVAMAAAMRVAPVVTEIAAAGAAVASPATDGLRLRAAASALAAARVTVTA